MNKIIKMEEYIEKYIVDGFVLNCIKNDNCITDCAKKNILWENWFEKIIPIVYEKNSNMIDIGAHIGTMSLMMSKYISKHNYIYAFEPVYTQITQLNIDDNKLSETVIVFPVGLSNKKEQLISGFIDFNLPNNYGYTTLDKLPKYNGDNGNGDNSNCLLIDLDTLDKYNFTNISFIKIDVEGNESKVLEGALDTIIKYFPSIFIELWCTSNNCSKQKKENTFDFENPLNSFTILFNLGYICFPISPNSDDFLFVHYSKYRIIENINKLLNNKT
jgi:FkbM family methyltransferase